MSDVKLLPCPFCGGKPQMMLGGYEGNWGVECTNAACQATHGTAYDSEAGALTAWNTRPQPAADADDVERAERVVRGIEAEHEGPFYPALHERLVRHIAAALQARPAQADVGHMAEVEPFPGVTPALRRAYEFYQANKAQAGYVLVPREPTDKMMILGGFRFAGRVPNDQVFPEVRKLWDDMLAEAAKSAAPRAD